MILHKNINYHSEYLFQVLRRQVEVTIGDDFATGPHLTSESIRFEIDTAVSKAV